MTAQASTAVAVRQDEPQLTPFEVIEKVITSGDLAKMQPQERVAFYWRTCQSLGLNPLTRPFEFINLNGKLTMYARKDATDQLRKINGVSVTGLRRERDDDLGLVTVYASGTDKTGRTDEGEGVVSIKGLSGEALANAIMKASTKAKRRLTLSLVGLGFLDESELPDGTTPDVDPTSGEILEPSKPPTLLESVQRQKARMDAAPATDGAGAADPAEPPTDTADEAAAAAGPAARDVTPPDWAAGQAAPDVVALLQKSAEASELEGPMTEPQRIRVGELVGQASGLEWAAEALPVLVAAFGEGFEPRDMTAAQAQAVVTLADTLAAATPPIDFAEAWRAAATN